MVTDELKKELSKAKWTSILLTCFFCIVGIGLVNLAIVLFILNPFKEKMEQKWEESINAQLETTKKQIEYNNKLLDNLNVKMGNANTNKENNK